MSAIAAFFIAFAVVGLVVLRLVRTQYQIRKQKKSWEQADKQQVFDQELSRYNLYYRSLDKQGRARFMARVVSFMESKDFQYVDLEPEEVMPLLISSTAIQLTFGLEHFRMDFFDTLYILKDKYRYGLYSTPFEGHVSEEGIYLSWGNFLRESNDVTDGQNVGLHEMAHALVYVNFTIDEGEGAGADKAFHDRFDAFSAVGKPVFERMQGGETNLLGDYAATNFQEFWAVCVETFFGRTVAFRKQLPELYSALSTLLNQDPLTPAKVIDGSVIY